MRRERRRPGDGRGVRPERCPAARSVVFVAFAAEESGLLGSQALAAAPPFPLKDMAAILNVDVLNVYGRTRDFSALGLDQSSSAPPSPGRCRRGAQGDHQPGGSVPGRILPLGSLLAGQGRRPWYQPGKRFGLRWSPGRLGEGTADKYIRRALPPAERPGSALVQLRRRIAAASRHRQEQQ